MIGTLVQVRFFDSEANAKSPQPDFCDADYRMRIADVNPDDTWTLRIEWSKAAAGPPHDPVNIPAGHVLLLRGGTICNVLATLWDVEQQFVLLVVRPSRLA